jgi:hypothetical protein
MDSTSPPAYPRRCGCSFEHRFPARNAPPLVACNSGKDTGHLVTWRDGTKLRVCLPALGNGVGTARVEPAAYRDVYGIRDLPRQDGAFVAATGIGHRDDLDENASVEDSEIHRAPGCTHLDPDRTSLFPNCTVALVRLDVNLSSPCCFPP